MKFQCSIRFHGLSPIRNISYLLPMCCSFWEKCINSQKNGLGCSTPLNQKLKVPQHCNNHIHPLITENLKLNMDFYSGPRDSRCGAVPFLDRLIVWHWLCYILSIRTTGGYLVTSVTVVRPSLCNSRTGWLLNIQQILVWSCWYRLVYFDFVQQLVQPSWLL